MGGIELSKGDPGELNETHPAEIRLRGVVSEQDPSPWGDIHAETGGEMQRIGLKLAPAVDDRLV